MTGGNQAASPVSPETFSAPAISVPDWVLKEPHPHSCKYNDVHEFWYQTPEDYDRGMSYHPDEPATGYWTATKVYRLAPYGELRLVHIGREVWCPLKDAGCLTGLPTTELTGLLREDEIYVRGVPGFLVPDGIRDLHHQGIDDLAIQVEALLAIVENSRLVYTPSINAVRDGTRILRWLRMAVLPDVYLRSPAADCAWSDPFDDFAPGAQLHRIYDPAVGEVRAVLLGTKVWIDVADISRATRSEATVIVQMAGKRRTVTIPNVDVIGASHDDAVATYVRFDAVKDFIEAMSWGSHITVTLEAWINETLYRFYLPNDTIKSSILGMMLGDFPDWAYDRLQKPRGSKAGDFLIPLILAEELARSAGDFAGTVTARLISDGGFLHGGPIDESPDDALLRFQGLVPVCPGDVDARKIHEFLGSSGSFDDWCQWHAINSEGTAPSSANPMVSLDHAMCQQVWWYDNEDRQF